MTDEEDDYMSDNFLAMTQNVKPGIAISAEHRRMLRIESERVRARKEDLAKPKKRELGTHSQIYSYSTLLQKCDEHRESS
ncbi:unnamed protein product [Cylicostephanus goldi]|uniref:Uncharacterized protein n=1 Tax=Cylicostephanus goldi TaxID=71465 RepID=A0A3P7QLM9_CYLGO|nr:unnamed protein product [Cylicostephanus goldi]